MFSHLLLLCCPLLVHSFNDKLFETKLSNFYNEARAAHSVPRVQLNYRLTTKAKLWAEYLSIMPGSNCLRHSSEGGQNIYFYWSTQPIAEEKLALKCADAFYKEIKYYNYGIPGYIHPAAHFTEMVWKSVTEIGIGIYTKSYTNRHGGCGIGGSPRKPAIGYMVVIQHNPAGNRDSKKQFLANVLRPVRMLKWLVLSMVLFACFLNVFGWSDASDPDMEQVLGRVYRTVLLKAKRSPSMGLSLAEYMASPQGGDNFHFIPGGRK